MGQRKVECFKCSQRGHIAVNSPVVKKDPATLVVTTEPDKEAADPWVLQLITDGEDTSPNCTTLSLRGPVCKAIVQVERIWTQTLVDFGAQVILIRCQMLPKIKEKQNWSLEQCHSCNRTLEQQLVGAGGKSLGAASVVALNLR